MTTYTALLSDIAIKSNDGKEWFAYREDGSLLCRAPSRSILEIKAAIYLKRLCCEDMFASTYPDRRRT